MVRKEREYPEKQVDSEIRKAKFNTRGTNRKNKSKNGVPVVSLLYIDQKVHEHFYSLKNQVLESQYIYIYIYIYTLTRFGK